MAARKRIAVWVGRQSWIEHRYYWTLEMLRDLAERDPNSFHRFLWAHHLAYAETYEVERRLSVERLHPSRYWFLDDLQACLAELDQRPEGIESVLDVGSSLGYVLRHLERHVFPAATRLEGIDIDGYAIEQGTAFLAAAGSRVRLQAGDMSSLDALLSPAPFDVVLSTGTLMYLSENDARSVIADMLARTRVVLALSGLAHPGHDNAQLPQSAVRERDGTFIHNLDAMVTATGGRVVRRRWEGARELEGNSIYFVFAVPAPANELAP